MKIYLMRHGDASQESGNPLSTKGISAVNAVADFLAQRKVSLYCIEHSTKLRARQTAEMLAQKLHPVGGVVETEGVAPLDDPTQWAGNLRLRHDDILLVSHLPYLPKLFSLLLCGYQDESIVTLPSASILCLERNADLYSLQWMITPDLVDKAPGS
jgi:phosphohistidine phosphatase